MLKILFILALLCHTACSRSTEDLIADLGSGGDQQAAAMQELLLANERAIAPLLDALEKPHPEPVRIGLVEILTSLLMRVEDKRISAALSQQLRDDPSPQVRAFIAHRMGLFKIAEGIPTLLSKLEDEDGGVRYEAMQALGALAQKLNPQEQAALKQQARLMLDDPHADARLEAMVRVEHYVNEWTEDARRHILRTELAQAESLYHQALDYSPNSKRGNYRSARFYFDHGQQQKGIDLLRRHGMLLDVPRLKKRPIIDGLVNPAEWRDAALIDSLLVLSRGNYATFPSEQKTSFRLGYTDQALFIGFYGHDLHPDSLVVTRKAHDEVGWREDLIELFFDANFDHHTYGQVSINSQGVITDEWFEGGMNNMYRGWNPSCEVAAHVGEAFWSIEFKIDFEPVHLPKPQPGSMWGFNAARTYRGSQYAQWVRTFFNAHSPNDFGILLFY